MAEIIKLGSLYFDGRSREVGVAYNGEQISFGDAASGREISWAKLQNGLLVADRCVCTNISWEDLNDQGFILGTPVTINGKTYLCRCLRVGTKGGEPNEWDSALDEAGDDTALWHWRDAYFWGQEVSKYGASNCAVRGYSSARGWSDYNTLTRYMYVGFRPVLEYLGSKSCPPDALLGREVKIYGPDSITVEGRLIDFSDYDIVLSAGFVIPSDCSWVRVYKNNIIISRDKVVWLEEV